jgi:hypothetical protein
LVGFLLRHDPFTSLLLTLYMHLVHTCAIYLLCKLQFVDDHGWVHGQVDSIDPTSYRVLYENGLLEHYSDQEMDEIVKLAAVQVGTRLAVFWYEEDCYHHATVFKERNETKSVLIEYDDGAGREWLDLRRNKFHILSHGNNNNNNFDGETREQTEIGQASVGNKESVYDGDCARDPLLGRVAAFSRQESNLSKLGRVAACFAQEGMSSPDEHNISARLRAEEEDDDEHDDGDGIDSSDDEMDMLTKENPSLSLVNAGTRVSLWWPDDAHYYVATVTHVRKTNAKPYYVEYDDGEFEWIDLRQHKFHLLSAAQETSRRVSVDRLEEAKNVTDTIDNCDPQPNVHDELSIKPTEAKDHAGSDVEPTGVIIAEKYLDLEAKVQAESEPELVETTEAGSQRRAMESESITELAGNLDSSSDRVGPDIEKALDHDNVENKALSESESDNDHGTRIAAQSDDETGIAAQLDDGILEDSEEEKSTKEENPDIAFVDVGSRVGIWWPEDRRYYKGVIVDRKRGRKPLKLKYDDDSVVEWINLSDHRFRLLRETVRRFSAPTIAKADGIEYGRDEHRKRRGAKRLKPRRVASKSITDDDNVKTGNVASLPKRWNAQILNSRRDATEPSSDTDNMDDETIETSVDVSMVRKRRRIERLNSRRAALKSSAETDSTDGKTEERNRDSSLVPEQPEAQPRKKSGQFASKPSSETSPRVRRRKLQPSKSSIDTDYAKNERGETSLETDNVDEERVEASPDVSLVSVGLRVAVWWPEDQKYYNGTVSKKRIGEMPFFLEYDDGEEEWINFINHRFRLLRDGKRRNRILVEVDSDKDCSDIDVKAAEASPDVSVVTVGSRVSVWWPDDRRHYKGIVTKERQGKNPFFLEYDDGEKEWINFSEHSFRLQSKTKPQRVERLKKRLASMSELSSSATGPKSSKDLKVEVGSRVSVFWPEERRYYEGTLTRQRNKKNPFFVEYDDGEKEWMDFREHRVRVLDKIPVDVEHCELGEERPSKQRRIDSSGLQTPSCALRCGKVEVGTRLSVWWSGDEAFFDGTVTRMRIDGRSKKPFHVEYDDGDNEWIDLALHTFRLLGEGGGDLESTNEKKDAASRQGIATDADVEGSRQSTKRSRSRTAAKKKANLDESDLNEKPSNGERDLKTSSVAPSQSLSKERNENLDDGRSKKRKGADGGLSCETRPEDCHLCRSGRMTKPRATECHHIFCESCIQDQFTSYPKCPVCNFRFGKSLLLYSATDAPTSFRSVERIDMTSGEVHKIYPSASAASREVPGASIAAKIVDACETKRKDGREYAGFFWRFFGTKARILRVDESAKDGTPVEQVNVETNEVLGTFPSSRQASEKTGVSRNSIRRVLDRRGKAKAGGFFWRFEGETNTPWQDPEPRCSSAVEKLCLESGDVLDTFDSLADAKRAMGMKPNNSSLSETCEGKWQNSALGFFWRWKGATIYPSRLLGYSKTVQIRRSENGFVVREFPTATKAAEWLGVGTDASTVCQWCRDHSYYREYYWSYAFTPVVPEEEKVVRNPEEEKLVGKRLRMRRNGNSKLLVGKVHAFNRNTGKFTILFDFGESEEIDLKSAAFQWMNDQGQKRVEKICPDTGQVRHTYDSISDAARDLGISATRISGVVNGRSISCQGFFWRFHGSDQLPPKKRIHRTVNQLCLKTGKVLATHQSIQEAAKTVGITTPGISYCCNGRKGSKSAGGFGWNFSSE